MQTSRKSARTLSVKSYTGAFYFVRAFAGSIPPKPKMHPFGCLVRITGITLASKLRPLADFSQVCKNALCKKLHRSFLQRSRLRRFDPAKAENAPFRVLGADNRDRTCTVSHRNLNPARLPIPPYPHVFKPTDLSFCASTVVCPGSVFAFGSPIACKPRS